MQEHSFARPLWARSRWGDLSTPLSARGPGCGVYTFVVRSRPDLTVFLTPTQVCPGERLRARVQLLSHGETPYDAIDVVLVGSESRYKSTTSDNDSSTRHYHRREVLRLGVSFPPGVLAPGLWEREVTFDIPRDAPPTYSSSLATIGYELEVRVHIPWWPDRRERYKVPVQALAVDPGAPRPQIFTTQAGDSRGDAPVLELSLEDDRLRLGGTLAGAVAVTGLRGRRIRRIEIVCVTRETALVKSSAGPTDVSRSKWVIHEGTPTEGASLPFRLAIPPGLSPSFRSPFIQVDHAIEAVAVVALGNDIALRVPALALRSAAARPSAPVPLIGSARHLGVWQAAVEQVRKAQTGGVTDIHFDPTRAAASFSVGDVAVSTAEEQRAVRRRARAGVTGGVPASDGGPCLVAELTWPALGLDLRMAERRWTDFGQRSPAFDAELAKRFTLRAREPEQAARFLDAGLRDWLLTFDEVGLDDEGLVVLRRGGVYKVDGLVRFLVQVQQLATQVARAAASIPPPAALEGTAAAWRSFAASRGVRLRPGDLALTGWSLRGVPLSLTHRFEEQRVVASELTTPLPSGADPAAWRDALGTATGSAAFVEAGQAGVTLPPPVEPPSLLPIAEAFTSAVGKLVGGESSPYR